jgi:hypothetical protein
MSRNRISAVIAVLALAAAALAPAARAATAPPHLVGTPTVRYSVSSNTDNGRFVTIGAVVRLDRRFAGAAEQHRYTIVAAPHLRRGQVLPDKLFGGGALSRVSNRPGAWYAAEAVQLHQRSSVRNGARWELALARGTTIVGAIKHVILRRA